MGKILQLEVVNIKHSKSVDNNTYWLYFSCMTKKSEKNEISPIEEAIALFGGNQKAFGERFGIRQQTISKWVQKGVVPLARVFDVERETGIPRHKLNPRFFSQERA